MQFIVKNDTRASKGRQKQHWERDFQQIVAILMRGRWPI